MKFGPVGVLEALKMAIQSEMDVGHFFSEASRVTNDEEVSEVFRKYGKEQKRRRSELQEKYRHISGKRLLYLNLNKKRKLEMSMECESNRDEILAAAKQNMQTCLNFYSDLSYHLLEPDYRSIFRTLAEEKERQLALLDSRFPPGDREEQDLKEAENSPSSVPEAA